MVNKQGITVNKGKIKVVQPCQMNILMPKFMRSNIIQNHSLNEMI